jgi:hypothetical protein
LNRLYENGAYSDLKIVCGSDTYLVHKALICPQSDFFRAACRPDMFQEGSTNVVNITASSGRRRIDKTHITSETFDWDLDVETTTSVKRMIHYFYHHDYQDQHTTLRNGVEMHESLFDEHSRMYAMGEKYGIPGLKAVDLRKVGQLGGKAVRTPSIIRATVIAFNSTPDSDQSLRMEVLRVLHHSRRVLKDRTSIHTMISSMAEVACGLYLMSIEGDLL